MPAQQQHAVRSGRVSEVADVVDHSGTQRPACDLDRGRSQAQRLASERRSATKAIPIKVPPLTKATPTMQTQAQQQQQQQQPTTTPSATPLATTATSKDAITLITDNVNMQLALSKMRQRRVHSIPIKSIAHTGWRLIRDQALTDSMLIIVDIPTYGTIQGSRRDQNYSTYWHLS